MANKIKNSNIDADIVSGATLLDEGAATGDFLLVFACFGLAFTSVDCFDTAIIVNFSFQKYDIWKQKKQV